MSHVVIGSNTLMTSVMVHRVSGYGVMHCSANSLRSLFHISAICRSLSAGLGVWLINTFGW